jgi:dTDP-4-amino-4,6-dideoxygalactose transaminase
VLPLDQDFDTLDIQAGLLDSLDYQDIAGIVLPNLYGLPDDIASVRSRIPYEVVIIDDACQSLLSTFDGQRIGLREEAALGVWSAGRGKALCSVGGGGVFCSESEGARELFELLEEEVSRLPSASRLEPIRKFAELFILKVLEHPNLFWIPAGIPFLGIGKVSCRYDFLSWRPSDTLLSYAQLQWENHLAKVKLTQQKVSSLEEMLAGVLVKQPYLARGFDAVPGVVPIRYPVLCANEKQRNLILERSSLEGLGLSASYGKVLREFSEIQGNILDTNTDTAHLISKCLLTLPVHAAVKNSDMRRIVEIIKEETPPNS